MKVQGRKISPESKAFLIAEVALTHDSSLGLACSFIKAAAKAGADAVKFQTHIASAESTLDEKFRTQFSYQDKTRYDYWKRTEFNKEEWQQLMNCAEQEGIIFLSSPFSIEAVHLLNEIGVPAWKIGSGEVSHSNILKAILDTKKPVLLSTGMSSYKEIDEAVKFISQANVPLVLLQCTSKYPTPLNEVGLNVMHEFREKYDLPVGLSDHSGQIYPALAAMAQGASVVEVHVTFHKEMFGPDVPVSLTFEELKILSEASLAFQTMRIHSVNKDEMSQKLHKMRELFHKSVALKLSLKAGTKLSEEHLTMKKPGTGIPAQDMQKCIGKVLKRDVSDDRLLTWDDIEGI